jgi:hypothetical protein
MALFFTALALVGFLLSNTLTWSRDGRVFASLVTCYWIAGLGGGAVVGVLRPHARGAAGASMIGGTIGFLVMLTFAVGSVGPVVLAERSGWYAGLFFGMPIGAFFGWATWRRSQA